MKLKTKKRLFISLGLLSLLSLIIWYFFPVFVNKWFIYESGFKKYLNVTPTYIDKLPEPPKEWATLSIDKLVLKLPISKYKIISGRDTYLNLASEAGSLVIYDIALSKELAKMMKEKKIGYPFTSYEKRLGVVKSLPSNVSFMNSRSKNEQSSANLILKAVGIPMDGLDEVRIVNPKLLKAICTISQKGEKGYSASVDLYSQSEKMSFSMLLFHYKDKAMLNSDLLSILSGVRLPNQPTDVEKVGKDIDVIVNKYKKT